MIKRDITAELGQTSKEYGVITVIGPRQSGKTTLVKNFFPNHSYVNLENPEARSLAQKDPRSFFKQFPTPMIIDEVQRVPELLSWIQPLVDESKKKAQFILTGSHQAHLEEAVTQSLAGRTAVLKLLPLSIHELTNSGTFMDRDEYIFRGFMPRLYDQPDMDATRLYRNYFETYVERDVRQIIKLKDLSVFENFLRLLAGRIGQVINYSSISGDIGVSATTIKEWLSILEASFVIFRLAPYYNNFGKRITKAPKIYFVDVGLASYLLGIESPGQVARDPLMGNLFENMVICEALKARLNHGKASNLYFFRDHNGTEVDLLYEQQRTLIPIEIKASRTYNTSLEGGLMKFKKSISVTGKGHLIYAGDLTPDKEALQVCNYKKCAQIFIPNISTKD